MIHRSITNMKKYNIPSKYAAQAIRLPSFDGILLGMVRGFSSLSWLCWMFMSPLASKALLAQSNGYPPSKRVDALMMPIFEPQYSGKEPSRANFRLFLNYQLPAAQEARLHLGPEVSLRLLTGHHVLSVEHEHSPGKEGRLVATLDGREMLKLALPIQDSNRFESTLEDAQNIFRMDASYTASVRFQTTGEGTLFSKSAPDAKWSPNAKALFIRNGRLVYDIGWLGAMDSDATVNDGQPHHVVLQVRDGETRLFLDGKPIASKEGFSAKDEPLHRFKIGHSASDFGLDWKDGWIQEVRFWKEGLSEDHLKAWLESEQEPLDLPNLSWQGALPQETFDGEGSEGFGVIPRLEGNVDVIKAWVQPLSEVDHAGLIAGWDATSLEEGEKIYQGLCVTCHGTAQQPGFLPTALKFHEGDFRNGHDPYAMYQTLTHGYGMMVPQGQYTPRQKYAVIQYIREALVRPHHREQYFDVSPAYLASLPRPLKLQDPAVVEETSESPQYQKMDFGPALMWTYQVNDAKKTPDWNIAQKGINVRLDPGQGGVSKGHAWMVYDEDTMRVAAAYSGDSFVDWRGIAFDGSHGTHTSISGDIAFEMPDAPAWQHPRKQSWEDQRIIGRDGRRFGPLPRDWVHYKGLYYHGDKVVVKYTVGENHFLEHPSILDYGDAPVFVRSFELLSSKDRLVARVAPDRSDLAVWIQGSDTVGLQRSEGFVEMVVEPSQRKRQWHLLAARLDEPSLRGLAGVVQEVDFSQLTGGGPPRFGQKVITTQVERGDDQSAFAVDVLQAPDASANPWESWMRLGGFDFDPDHPDRAAVCTWMGDVWLVEGVGLEASELKWRRICSGLFQPLGLKIHQGKIYVTCRDQIARLHDLNGDDEIDYVESFNNDAQVTEHFHEFAMGLQVDPKGDFYYAKSARHAKTALVPHHGTLLRVSADGTRTDIVANGFRAANGVCLNPDGSWIVTDQEGHWNPKNRINYVREGGFYGNMFGYHEVKDSSDDAMEQPLCWITNAFDRSPAELLWVNEKAQWGPLNGVLLNLSYGYGKIYTVPHEFIEGQAQGGMCALPMKAFPTGVMRGRFHPVNGQLYTAGMFAWAGNQQQAGGFYRVRYTGKPAHVPLSMQATTRGVRVTFSDPLDASFVEAVDHYQVEIWDLKRTANYGSKHYNQRPLKIESVDLQRDDRTLMIEMPDIQPTWGMEIRCTLKGLGETEPVERIIHHSIHRLGNGLF